MSPRPIGHASPKSTESPARAELRQLFKEEVNTQAWITNSGRFALVSIKDPEKYLELHKAGAFKYQHEGTDRPSTYPDPERVAALLEQK